MHHYMKENPGEEEKPEFYNPKADLQINNFMSNIGGSKGGHMKGNRIKAGLNASSNV